MKCYVHPDVDPVGTCTSCGRGICGECAVEVQGKLVCRDCLAAGKVTTRKYDPNDVFLIELLPGFLGFLGVGYMYVGRTSEGALRLVLFLLWNLLAWCGIILLGYVLIGLCLIPIQLAIQIGIPVWSATTLKNELLSGVSV